MESITNLVGSWSNSRESAVRMATGVAGNPELIAGLLLGYLVLGLITVIMAFWSQRSRLSVFDQSIKFSFSCKRFSPRGIQNVTIALFPLYIMTGVNAATAVILAIYLISNTCGVNDCVTILIVWLLTKSFGVILHLQSALVSVLYLCHPHWAAKQQYITCAVSLLIIVFIPVYIYATKVAIIGFAVVIFGLALAIIVKLPTSTALPSAAITKKCIVFVAMFTLLVVYFPNFVLQCLIINSTPATEDYYAVIYTNILFCTNIQLILDGLLCLFILKLPAGVEEQQQQHRMEMPPPYTIENVFK